MRPWFWLLGHKADCRIFLDKDVKDIIKDVFNKAGFHDFEFRTNGDYEKIPYCVQYRETDLAFVSRLMELYGIYYFFEHSEDKHLMVLANSRSSHKAVAGLPKVAFVPLSEKELRPGPASLQLDFGATLPYRKGPVQRLRLSETQEEPAGAFGSLGEVHPRQARGV